MSVPPGAPAAPLHRPPQPTTIANVEKHFPGVHCWWGLSTSHWWAYVPTPQGGYLLEATTPDALIAQISDRTKTWR